MKTTKLIQRPSQENQYLCSHTELLRSSFRRWLGEELLAGSEECSTDEFASTLFHAAAVVVSHGAQSDPTFNYGNAAALALFEMNWADFVQLPSRKSAEPMNREERNRLLVAVAEHNFIDDYSGVRISSSGRRFFIPQAVVWNLVDATGTYRGQAATFSEWQFL